MTARPHPHLEIVGAPASEQREAERLVNDIRQLADDADEAEARAGSELRWQRAEKLVELFGLSSRWTQAEIGRHIDRSQTHVSLCIQAVRYYQRNRRPLWAVAYAAMKHRDKPGAVDDRDVSATRPSWKTDPDLFFAVGLKHFTADQLRVAFEKAMRLVEKRDAELAADA